MRPPTIDTHVHLWDLSHPSLVWNWIDTPADHPVVGEIDAVKARAYRLRDLVAETRFEDIEAFVHVQAAIGSPDPVEETRWLTAMAAEAGVPLGIVAHADLGTDAFAGQLAGHLESPLLRGVRDFAVEPYLAAGRLDPAMERDLDRLAEAGLVLDLDCGHAHMAAARDLAQRHPGLSIVLEHVGFPRTHDAAELAEWRPRLAELAQAPNVICKVSGLAMVERGYSLDSWRPWVHACVEAFGPDRIVVGSNWPLDRVGGPYGAALDHLARLLAEIAPEHLDQMLRGTAARVYRPERLA